MNQCVHCKQLFEENRLYETGSGDMCCEDCAYTHCSTCLEGSCEIENSYGEYICGDCYSGAIDDAYEIYREMN